MNQTTKEDNVMDKSYTTTVPNTSHKSGEAAKRSANPVCEPLSLDPHKLPTDQFTRNEASAPAPAQVGAYPCPLPTPKGYNPNADHAMNVPPIRNGSSHAAMSSTTKMMSATKSNVSSFNHGWSNNSRSDSLDSTSSAPLKPHTGGDVRWDAITCASSRDSPLGLSNFRLLKRLGYGDIGSVYLVELRGSNTFFAMKVMDKASLASRNKLLRAQTEREILGLLDHPFLPTLYSYFETEKFYCLVMEFCSGGNLHSLRQKQPNKHFTEEAARLIPIYLIYLLLRIL